MPTPLASPKQGSEKKQVPKKKPLKLDALTELYRELDRSELTRQGADHLQGRIDVRARRAVQVVRFAAWTVIIVAVVLGAGFCGWLLLTAKHSGQTFSEVREQVIRAYDEPGD